MFLSRPIANVPSSYAHRLLLGAVACLAALNLVTSPAARAASRTLPVSTNSNGSFTRNADPLPGSAVNADNVDDGSAESALLAPVRSRHNSGGSELLDLSLLEQQVEVGQLIGDGLLADTAEDRFNQFVTERAIGEVDRVADGVAHFAFAENGQKVNVALVDLQATGVAVSPAGHSGVVGSYASQVGGIVSINGNWFGPWDGPAVSEGHVYAGDDHAYTALFGITANNDVIVEHHTAVTSQVDPRVRNGVSGHPTLVHDGALQSINPDPTFLVRHPRTVIAEAVSPGVLILVTVDGRQPGALGMTGDETAQLMLRLGAKNAVMLDGGGSSTMWISERGIVNSPPGAPRVVANELAITSG